MGRGGGRKRDLNTASPRVRAARQCLLKYGLLVVIYNVKFVEFNRGRSHSTPAAAPAGTGFSPSRQVAGDGVALHRIKCKLLQDRNLIAQQRGNAHVTA